MPYLTVANHPVVVSVGQQHVVQGRPLAGLGGALEEDVVREGPVHVYHGPQRRFVAMLASSCTHIQLHSNLLKKKQTCLSVFFSFFFSLLAYL